MKNIAAGTNTVKGIDISHHNSVIDWASVKNAGIEFVIAKASEGTTEKDPLFKAHYSEAKASGLLFGAYHFFHAGSDPMDQVKNFSEQIKNCSLDLPLVLDWEVTDGVPSTQDVRNALIFLSTIAKTSPKKPMIYTGPYFFDALKSGNVFEAYLLWIAHYTSNKNGPLVPDPFKNWTMWQFTDRLSIPNCSSGIDGDLFNGTIEQLKQLG